LSSSAFSIVVSVHDELDLFRFSLPSFYALQPDEVIVCLDDNGDETDLNAVRSFSLRLNQSERTRMITVIRNPAYSSYIAWKRRQGFMAAANDRILSVDPDLILNHRVHKALKLAGLNNIGYVSCTTIYPISHPLQFCQSIVHYAVSRLHPPPLTGLYALWRPYWLDSEDYGIAQLRDPLESEAHGSMVAIGEDTYLLNRMRTKHRSIHLRTVGAYSMKPYHNVSREAQYELGRYYAAIGQPSLTVLLKSMVLLQPHLLRGYIRQREAGSSIPKASPKTYPLRER
jgi:hypothetical protein